MAVVGLMCATVIYSHVTVFVLYTVRGRIIVAVPTGVTVN